jgi:phenylacetate-CoA ligase
MHSSVLRAYHRLPPALRSVAATLRGAYLRSWRYGPETERLIEDALEREQWTAARWDAWRGEQIARVLHRAATSVPYYRRHWELRRRAGDRRAWDCLDHWPVLEKDTVRQHARELVADGCDPRRMFHEVTSGTTGTPLDLWWPRAAVRGWYALFEARVRRRFGVSRRDRWAMLGGQLVAPAAQRRPPFWVWNPALHQLYMSSYHLAPALVPAYIDALARYRITHLFGYTSSLYSLALDALRQRRRDLNMAVAITNAEPVLDHQRAAIAEAFGPVCETYGQTEIVACASECRDGGLHLWPEVGALEILDDGRPVSAGRAGEVIGTSLLNPDMPLVRYRLGDHAALAADGTACACGRTLPRLARIEGRSDDLLYTADGRRIGRLDPVFKSDCHLREAQIVQESLRRVRVRYVPGPGFTRADDRAIAAALRDRLGAVEVVLEPVAEIARSSRGKFRAVVCAIPETERRLVSAHS